MDYGDIILQLYVFGVRYGIGPVIVLGRISL